MTQLRIEPIGPHDDRFAEWHATLAAAYAQGREPGWWESLHARAVYFARPETRTRYRALIASIDGRVVGAAELAFPLDADVDTMSVELGVRPDSRRQGVGTALADAVRELARTERRAVAQTEVFVPTGHSGS